MFDPPILLALGAAGLLAGFVDAIAGGGGLITVPALLLAGVPPVAALGTNKAQAVIGTSMAAITYWRGGYVQPRVLLLALVVTFIASFCGASVAARIDTSTLAVAVPIALLAIAGYLLFAPRLSDEDRHARLDFARFVPVLAAVIGFYDGILGPGTGSFLTMGFVGLFGLGVTRAAGNTKIVNLASNFGGLTLFILTGNVAWLAAAVMAVGQVAGGYLGARTGIRFGARLIRPLVVAVSVILAVKLLFFN
jgi:uncharacterized membrane protein YfcA